MSYELAGPYVKAKGYGDHIIHLDISTATVEMAAEALHVIPARIAKTLSFRTKEGGAFLVVLAGDYGVDNKKFKETFGLKASMLTYEEVETLVGHKVGGVCPFGVKEGVKTYIDESVKRFETIFPACGDVYNVMELTPEQLFDLSEAVSYVDVGKQRIQ